jgi:hypothetical protein
MTEEQADALFGRAARELKSAEAVHNRNIGMAITMAAEYQKLSEALMARANAADMAGQLPTQYQDEPLSLTGIIASFDATVLKNLDRDISASLATLKDARRLYDKTKP